MRKGRKPKSKPELPPLCRAVRRIREATGWSQEQMAQHTRIASQTISRFELGKQVPRDMAVLLQLREAAAASSCAAEEKLFQEALIEQSGSLPRHVIEPSIVIQTYRPHVWRLMQAARIAIDFFPETARAMEKAAGPALDLVDEIFGEVATEGTNFSAPNFYSDLETRLSELAARKLFQQFQKGGDR
jgi:transcriptional regulator with XRE-family HTH domain